MEANESHVTGSSSRTIIPLSRAKLVFLLFVAIAFVITGIWLLQAAAIDTPGKEMIFMVSGICAIAFFGCLGGYVLYRLFDKRPGLVIDASGITTRSNALGSQIIGWNDISGFAVREIRNTRFLLVYLQEPGKFTGTGNRFQRWLLRLNHTMYGTPVSISSTTLRCRFEELVPLIIKKYNEYRSE